MTKKTSNAAPPSADPHTAATCPKAKDSALVRSVAHLATHPSANAAAVMEQYSKPLGNPDARALMDELSDQIKAVNDGDLKQAEAMLYAQAHALQAIFMNFSRRALNQDHQPNLESFLRMALKAQSQCRMTLETLAAIKNPPVVIARQANIAHGPQQVNNGPPPVPASHSAASHAGKKSTVQNELLETHDGERLDTRTTSPAGRADPQLAPMGAVHRTAHG